MEINTALRTHQVERSEDLAEPKDQSPYSPLFLNKA